MRLQQMIIGMMLLLSFGVSQAEEARHYIAVSNESYSFTGLDALSYRYGYDFTNMISAEINHSVTNLESPTATILSVDSITNLMFHFNRRYESITTYFAVGYANATMTQAAPANLALFSGLSYGLGIELYGSKDTAISFAWMRRIVFETGSSEKELDSVQIGLLHHFEFAKSVTRY